MSILETYRKKNDDRRAAITTSTTTGLTVPQQAVLLYLLENGQLPIGKLSDELGCSRGNMTGICQRLALLGLVTRERHTKDERILLVGLTGTGRKKADELAALEASA